MKSRPIAVLSECMEFLPDAYSIPDGNVLLLPGTGNRTCPKLLLDLLYDPLYVTDR